MILSMVRGKKKKKKKATLPYNPAHQKQNSHPSDHSIGNNHQMNGLETRRTLHPRHTIT